MHVSFVYLSVPHFPFVFPPVFSPSYYTVIDWILGTVLKKEERRKICSDANILLWVGKLAFTELGSENICGIFVLEVHSPWCDDEIVARFHPLSTSGTGQAPLVVSYPQLDHLPLLGLERVRFQRNKPEDTRSGNTRFWKVASSYSS